MKHIHTTATAIRKIKALAKKIKSEQCIQLAKALDYATIESGYESFHHATRCLEKTNNDHLFKGLGELSFVIEDEKNDWPMFDDDGNDMPPVLKVAAILNAGNREQSLDDVTEEFDEISDEVGSDTGDMTEIPLKNLKTLIAACTRLTKREPEFIDGYAHWAGALVCLERHEDCIAMAEPVFNAILALIPNRFSGFIPYAYLQNRPFHRLAFNLTLAYLGAGKNSEAKAIIEKMLSWWPNDNMGFQFCLSENHKS
jgi:tetratricopeptide (TPR) repeat protein